MDVSKAEGELAKSESGELASPIESSELGKRRGLVSASVASQGAALLGGLASVYGARAAHSSLGVIAPTLGLGGAVVIGLLFGMLQRPHPSSWPPAWKIADEAWAETLAAHRDAEST